MLPVRLELKNFLAYRDPVIVQFDGLGLACLTGPNGAGKSSLLDAMTWALWGEARGIGRNRMDELIHHGQEEMQVQLDFMHDHKLYRVLRKRSRKGRGSSTLDFFASTGDNGWNSVAEPTMTATQRKIDDMLHMNMDMFTHSAFLQQGKADSFTNLGPAERKNALAEMLGVERFKTYESAAKDQAQTIQRELDALRGKLEQIEADLEREPALVTQHRLAEEQYASASAALAEADARQQELEYVKPALDASNRAAADIQRRLDNARRSLQDANRRLAEAESEVKRREEALAQREQVETGYQELLHARTENQALNEKFQHYVHLREQIRDRDTEVAKLRAALEAQAGTLQAKMAAAGKVIQEADPEAFSRANEDVKRLDEAEAALTAAREDIHRFEQERSALQAGTKVLQEDIDKRRVRYKNLREVEGATCPLCGQPLNPEHRKEVLADIEATGKELNAQVSENTRRTEEIDHNLQSLKTTRKNAEMLIKQLEQSRAVAARFADRQARAHEAEAELGRLTAEYDALQADLAAGQFAAGLTAEIAALQAERDALGYEESSHKEAKRRLSEHETYDQAHLLLQQAEAALPGAKHQLEQAQQNLTLYQGEVENEQTALDAENARRAELSTLLEEFQQRRQIADDLRRKANDANRSLITAQQELKTLDDQRARRDLLQARQEAHREQRGIYEELSSAFGKNGIPAMLIETAIPEIEEDANRLLWTMTGGRMTVRVNTQRERQAGGTIETLDFLVTDELGERSIDIFSGGEAFRINFALRVALSELLARRAGAHLQTLFLDEGFGTQDDEGRARLVEAITAVKDRFDLILVITHIDELRDSFPVHLTVTKKDDGSTVAIR